MGNPDISGGEDGLTRLEGSDFRPLQHKPTLLGAEIGRIGQGTERLVVIKAEDTAPQLALQS